MSQHLIIICIVSILLWYYYTKSKEQDDKYIPVMIRQSELLNENNLLKQDNKKLKTKIKYLENYKNDVSKTFKILDNELVLINDHIKNQSNGLNTTTTTINTSPQQHITSVTPNILNSLLRHEEIQVPHGSHTSIPNSGIFNNMFNRFLTGDMNFRSSREESNIPLNENLGETECKNENEHVNENAESNENLDENIDENVNVNVGEDTEQTTNENNSGSVQFSVNYVPLNSTYRQFLIRREDPTS